MTDAASESAAAYWRLVPAESELDGAHAAVCTATGRVLGSTNSPGIFIGDDVVQALDYTKSMHVVLDAGHYEMLCTLLDEALPFLRWHHTEITRIYDPKPLGNIIARISDILGGK